MRSRTQNSIVDSAIPAGSTLYAEADDEGTQYPKGYYDGGVFTNSTSKLFSPGVYGASRMGLSSTIDDVPQGSGQYNPVEHEKFEWDFPIQTVKVLGRQKYYGYQSEYECDYSSSAHPQLFAYRLSRPQPLLWDSEHTAISRAIQKMEFGIQSSGLSLPIFVGELRDFRTVFNKSMGMLQSKRGIRTELRQRLKRLVKQDVSVLDMFRMVASGDLAYQFVVKPLLSDLTAMMQLGSHMRSQRARLESVKPVRVRGSYRETDQRVDTAYWGDNTYTGIFDSERLSTAFALVQYDYANVPQLPPLVAAADALGFDQPISTIWELIPWSFAVDYFVQMGDWLAQFDGQFIELPYTILQQGTSTKTSTKLQATVQPLAKRHSGWTTLENHSPNIEGTAYWSKYVRRAESLEGYVPPLTPSVSLPSFRQVQNILDIVFLRSSG